MSLRNESSRDGMPTSERWTLIECLDCGRTWTPASECPCDDDCQATEVEWTVMPVPEPSTNPGAVDPSGALRQAEAVLAGAVLDDDTPSTRARVEHALHLLRTATNSGAV